ncbi:hypothetical protein SESBI_34589 [Sesbania bispinosa]|nr:hypothetical protein SESBI_34589 [Sesbania bispinosa]
MRKWRRDSDGRMACDSRGLPTTYLRWREVDKDCVAWGRTTAIGCEDPVRWFNNDGEVAGRVGQKIFC